jgi:hypothetical protein
MPKLLLLLALTTLNTPDSRPTPDRATATMNVMCCDGTRSPTCTTCRRGCCSWHGGCCGFQESPPNFTPDIPAS